jgi:hypothetical protein
VFSAGPHHFRRPVSGHSSKIRQAASVEAACFAQVPSRSLTFPKRRHLHGRESRYKIVVNLPVGLMRRRSLLPICRQHGVWHYAGNAERAKSAIQRDRTEASRDSAQRRPAGCLSLIGRSRWCVGKAAAARVLQEFVSSFTLSAPQPRLASPLSAEL